MSGKALPLDTNILTPTGWKQMRDIHIGDIVYDENGEKTIVIGEYPQQELKQEWLITFSDNTSIKCCEDHLWKFKIDHYDKFKSSVWQEDTIKNIIDNFQFLNLNKINNIAIPINKPIQFDKQNLIIPPYLLGALIGDGYFGKDIVFYNPEDDLINKVKQLTLNNNLGEFYTNPKYPLRHTYRYTNSSLLKQYIHNTFGKLCIATNKFIPKEYLLSSIDDRFELARGLIDTDGTLNNLGRISFCTVSKQLADDFKFLIQSLGYRLTIRTDNRNNNIAYICDIKNQDDKLFSSQKHKQKYINCHKPLQDYNSNLLRIKSIKKLETQSEMKCLTVDSSKHTYICDNFIVTHNTATFKALAKLLDRPLILESITSVTVSGIVGRDVTDILAHAIRECNNDIPQAEKAIILIDEFDKTARNMQTTSGRDVAGVALQQEFLKLLEGDKIQVQLGNKHSPLLDNTVEINTSNILFVLSGAFVGLDQVVKNRINKKQIGFGQEDKKYTIDELLQQVTTDDLITYGLIPELVGRIPQIVIYNQLTENDLIKILTEPNNAIIKQYQELFQMDNVNLQFTTEVLQLIAKLAISKKTNARGLKSIVSSALSKIEYDIPDRDDIDSIIITNQLVNNLNLK